MLLLNDLSLGAQKTLVKDAKWALLRMIEGIYRLSTRSIDTCGAHLGVCSVPAYQLPPYTAYLVEPHTCRTCSCMLLTLLPRHMMSREAFAFA